MRGSLRVSSSFLQGFYEGSTLAYIDLRLQAKGFMFEV